MRKQLQVGMLAALALIGGATGSAAQGTLPIAFEARLDAGLPVGDAGDVFEGGVGFGVAAIFQATPTLGIYGGYSSFEFNVEGTDADVTVNGPEAGIRVTLGTGGAVWTPFAQVGALFHEDETGFEVGLGGDYPVGQNVSVTPMARYRTIDDFDYVALGIGVNLRL